MFIEFFGTLDWVTEPTAWAGFFTLVLLELVLGIDNLVFIAILAEKLPPRQRDSARKIGLGLALIMRIVLLASISWMAQLTDPLLTLFGHVFSGRDLILLIGGLFLLWKATHEIHGRLEGRSNRSGSGTYHAKFWMVVTQIIILDAVFSLDAVITAVGMTEHLSMMILAVSVAIFIMMVTSKPLTVFVGKHPTVVMLCLGFLLMVGFSLVAEGFGAEIPKGYLYAAIGFSVLIEAINQFAQVKLKRRVMQIDNVRQKTSDAILKLLGAKQSDGVEEVQEAGALLQEAARGSILTPVEKELLRGVLNLSERSVHSVMTPRIDAEFLDIREPWEDIFAAMKEFTQPNVIVYDGEMDNVMGILRWDEFLLSCLEHGGRMITPKDLQEPIFVQQRASVMSLLETFQKQPVEMAVVIDEFGSVEGVVTHLDLLEAIAGEFPDRDEPEAVAISDNGDGTFLIDGLASIYDVRNRLGVDYEPDGRFATIGGLILHELGRFPTEGDRMAWQGFELVVAKMDGRRIDVIEARTIPDPFAE